jgi:hypothetical protein
VWVFFESHCTHCLHCIFNMGKSMKIMENPLWFHHGEEHHLYNLHLNLWVQVTWDLNLESTGKTYITPPKKYAVYHNFNQFLIPEKDVTKTSSNPGDGKWTMETWGRGWMTKASGVGERRKGRRIFSVSREMSVAFPLQTLWCHGEISRCAFSMARHG